MAISQLQFADDMLIIGSKCSQNIWSIEMVLRLFELLSGMIVNSHKRQLLRINVDEG